MQPRTLGGGIKEKGGQGKGEQGTGRGEGGQGKGEQRTGGGKGGQRRGKEEVGRPGGLTTGAVELWNDESFHNVCAKCAGTIYRSLIKSPFSGDTCSGGLVGLCDVIYKTPRNLEVSLHFDVSFYSRSPRPKGLVHFDTKPLIFKRFCIAMHKLAWASGFRNGMTYRNAKKPRGFAGFCK